MEEIIKGSKSFILRVAEMHELPEVKAVDDCAFGNHHGISMEELHTLYHRGKIIILVEKETGKIIGETQVLFTPINELPYQFDHHVAYCYGIGVLPEYQRQGFGKILMNAHDTWAKQEGLKESHMTIRAENYPSIKLMIDVGYHIFGYDPTFYGKNIETDARLLLRKSLNGGFPHLQYPIPETGIFVPIVYGDTHDKRAHQSIKILTKRNHTGRRIDRQGLYFFPS
ncbi:MAG: GNAT family N-acetyltransferase [bacterium]